MPARRSLQALLADLDDLFVPRYNAFRTTVLQRKPESDARVLLKELRDEPILRHGRKDAAAAVRFVNAVHHRGMRGRGGAVRPITQRDGEKGLNALAAALAHAQRVLRVRFGRVLREIAAARGAVRYPFPHDSAAVLSQSQTPSSSDGAERAGGGSSRSSQIGRAHV